MHDSRWLVALIIGGMVAVTLPLSAMADSEIPSYGDFYVNSTYPGINDSIQINFTVTDNISVDSVIFSWNVSGSWVNDSAIGNLTQVIYGKNWSYCYQESANVSTSCGGVSSGVYSWDDGWTDPSNWTDADWNSYSNATTDRGFNNKYAEGYVNYSIPSRYVNLTVIAQLKSANAGLVNVSLPQQCIFGNMAVLNYELQNYGGLDTNWRTRLYCQIDHSVAFESSQTLTNGYFYEEAIYWPVSSYQNVSVQLNKSLALMVSSRNLSIINYKIYANDSSNNWNVSLVQSIGLKKYLPNTSVVITNVPLLDADAINLSILFDDWDNDSWRSNWTRWVKNGVELTAYENLTSLSKDNTSNGDNFTAMVKVCDLFNCSADWVNATVTIGDQIAPTFQNFSVSSSSVTIGTPVTFCVGVTDNVLVSSCVFELYNSGFADGPLVNRTWGTFADNVFCREVSTTGLTPGQLYWNKTRCYDFSSNLAINDSMGVNIVLSLPVSGGGGASGGGSPIIIVVNNQSNVSACNNNGACESGEGFFNCGDCTLSQAFWTCEDPNTPCVWKDNKNILVWSVGFLILLVVIVAEPFKKKHRSVQGSG